MISWNPARRASVAALIVALALAAGCSSSNPASPGSTAAVNTTSTTNPGTSGPTSGSTGTLTVMLKDKPLDAKALLVTFTEVSAHKSAGVGGDTGEWTSLSPVPFTRTCDLMRLNGPQDVLGTGLVEKGHYTQIRLKVDSATLYFENGSLGADPCVDDSTLLAPPEKGEPVTVPKDTIKLNREFDVPADKEIVITLDFDANKSIHETGNGKFMMTPVITILNVN